MLKSLLSCARIEKKNMGRVVVANLAHKAFEFSLFKSAHT